MGKYGKIAILAVKNFHKNNDLTPRKAWEKAEAEISKSKRDTGKKDCPKSAFLGLCEEGKVKGIPAGDYTTSKKNKGYALRGLALLQSNQDIYILNPKLLWEDVCDGTEICPNYQMDVVISLFVEELIS